MGSGCGGHRPSLRPEKKCGPCSLGPQLRKADPEITPGEGKPQKSRTITRVSLGGSQAPRKSHIPVLGVSSHPCRGGVRSHSLAAAPPNKEISCLISAALMI